MVSVDTVGSGGATSARTDAVASKGRTYHGVIARVKRDALASDVRQLGPSRAANVRRVATSREPQIMWLARARD